MKKDTSKDDTSDRNHEKDNFDGTLESLFTGPVTRTQADAAPQVVGPKKGHDLTSRSEVYKRMCVRGSKPVAHTSDR